MASMTGMTPEQLAALLAGTDAMAMPSYSINSIYDGVLPTLPPPPMATLSGPPQGTKRDRGSLSPSYNSLTEPWGGAYDQTAYRSPAPARLPSQPTGGPKLLPYVDPTLTYYPVDPRTGQAGERVTRDPALGAIEKAAPPLPRQRPSVSLPTMSDPLLEEANRIGKAYKPSAKVQAALSAQPPTAAAAQRSGGLLGMLLGGLGGGTGPQGGGNGLGALLSGMGGPISIPQSGQLIQTDNNGTQVIGQRLNNSPKGRTVTNDAWFNAVTGL